MCNFKSALLIPRFPSTDGFDIFHREGVHHHTELMELAGINPNDTKINVAKLELIPFDDPSDINKWEFILDEDRRPDWLDDVMLADAEYQLRQICNNYISKDGECTVLDCGDAKEWYLNGKRHREDGPAVEYPDGNKSWYINGKRHREDGPAIEGFGRKEWYLNGERHREGGPAIESSHGYEAWYLNGNSLTEEEFNAR
jgi:hypothetical protein